jgi:glycosyltransferase involved in cell wall biosynthesis
MVVHIAFDFFCGGTPSRRARQDVEALLNAGHRVTVITNSDQGPDLTIKEKFANQLRVIAVCSIPPLAVTLELSFAAQCWRALTNVTRKESVDLLVSHAATPCYAAACFAKREKIPSVFVIQALIRDKIGTSANPYSWPTTQMYRHANRFAASNMHYSVAISRYVKQLAIAEGATPENTFVLHNPVDTQTFFPHGDATKDIDVLFIGRLVSEKGLPVLIEAAHRLSKETRILIVGDGPLRGHLERRAQHVGCEIIFQGWIQNELVPQYIRRARLQVVPSLSEAQGLVVLEAMACGVPVIGTETGGIPDMIKHGENGWLVPPSDAEALARTIKAVLANDRERDAVARAGYETAQSFSVNQFSYKALELYEKMTKKFSA